MVTESTVFFSVRPPTESLCAKHQEVTVDELSRMLEPTIKSGHFYCTKVNMLILSPLICAIACGGDDTKPQLSLPNTNCIGTTGKAQHC